MGGPLFSFGSCDRQLNTVILPNERSGGGEVMAKRTFEPNVNGEKAKVRVFFAELEGNNESVQEALKTMVSAMSRPVRIISDGRGNAKNPTMIESGESEAILDQIEDLSDSDVPDEDVVIQSVRKTRGTGTKKDRNAGLELVPNLNFRPDGQHALKDFFQLKSPSNDIEATLIFVYYLQKMMNVGKVGPSHVMTAFKEVGRAIPADLRQAIRNIKKTKMWLNFSDIEDVKMTTQGDNFVEHEMGKGGK